MRLARPDSARLWLALAAFVGAMLWGSGSATACSTMKMGACATACGCCEPGPSRPGGVDAADPVMPSRIVSPPPTQACGQAPADRCACRDGRQDAPEPKTGQRAADARPDSACGMSATWIAVVPAPTMPARSLPPGTGTPQATPLYLRNSRLLI